LWFPGLAFECRKRDTKVGLRLVLKPAITSLELFKSQPPLYRLCLEKRNMFLERKQQNSRSAPGALRDTILIYPHYREGSSTATSRSLPGSDLRPRSLGCRRKSSLCLPPLKQWDLPVLEPERSGSADLPNLAQLKRKSMVLSQSIIRNGIYR